MKYPKNSQVICDGSPDVTEIYSEKKWVSRVLRPARHIIGHFRNDLSPKWDESFQAITCTGTDNSKQRENTPKTQTVNLSTVIRHKKT